MAGQSHAASFLCLSLLLIGAADFGGCFGPAPFRFHSSDWRRQDEPLTCPEPKGQFDHPRFCDLFLNCWDGRASVGSCGGGLVFNEKIRACDYPRNVDCRGRGSSQAPPPPDPRCQEPYGTYPNPNNCSEYFVCHAGKATVISCPENTYYDPTPAVCTHEMPQSCINLDPCPDPHAPGCPPIPAGTPTQSPTEPPTLPLKPKPSFAPDPPPNPSIPQFQPTAEPTSSPSEPSTIPLKPKPPLKPQHPTPSPSDPTIPPEISEVKPEEPPTPNPPPPLKPGGLKPVSPGGPPNLGPSGSTATPVDGEDDPNVLFPFLPAFPSAFRCPVKNGLFPVQGQCERIVACVGGEAHLMECPKGMSFDSEIRRCGLRKCSGGLRIPSKVLYVKVPAEMLMMMDGS